MWRAALSILVVYAGWQLRWLLDQPAVVARPVGSTPTDQTTTDPATGAVRSVQTADLLLPDDRVAGLWSPRSLERLARTYWRYLTRVTLGLIRVGYRDDGRDVYLLFPPLRLLTFAAPEYEMDATRGVVRWRIEKGLLVSRHYPGNGFLEIDITRREDPDPTATLVHVEVEVANFYPSIAFGISRWLYSNTQSRIHVLVTHGFLRSLARLDLAESRVGRFAAIEEVPDPGPRRREPRAASAQP